MKNYNIDNKTSQMTDTGMISQELDQLRKLLSLGVEDDKELAHRMATTPRAVKKMRRMLEK